MEIRTATINDLDAITNVEAECFPLEEAATYEEFQSRLEHYPDHFWLIIKSNAENGVTDKIIELLRNQE